MASMDRVMELNFRSTDEDAYFQESHDWTQPQVFQQPRHIEKIEGSEVPPQGWRMKERMKTVSVALVLCLNVGVDPPNVIKLTPCARLECWIDPLSLSPQKALEQIGQNLQKQYERWQPRARYKQSLDPTVDEVKKLCVSLRRNAKEERLLFHYNGHGVPCPTTNGEIWVFNRNYTQYIPLSIYDLQTWMGYPSIYVYDCNNAGIIIKSFNQFSEQHEREYYSAKGGKTSPVVSGGGDATPSTEGTTEGRTSRDGTPLPPPNYSSCIQLGACGESQILPMNPDLPADLFTACLTTPIRMALRWFVLQNQGKGSGTGNAFNKLLSDGINLETIERVPGQLNDRRTMLGELNWIFTAITDTIAWNILPRALFQKLFRQDLLVASLFRNFLLAERIMRSYDAHPVSSPKLPPTSHHPMWHAWDYALDQCLTQLRARELLTSPAPQSPEASAQQQFVHTPSPFFEEQLTAFEVWLELGNEKRSPPEQLPIVLQVLLSQVHRVRALELLGKFLDLGWWAVNLALSVGIFPYVLKLLQSSARELRPLLVFIWAKILAVDQSCQTDLVRDGSHKYFIQMISDSTLPQETRTMAVFVLSNIVRSYPQGQQAALQANSIATCLLTLEEADDNPASPQLPNPSYASLHKWICICLGLTWQDFPSARWCGVRDSAHEKIAAVLTHQDPEVRAAGVFALGSFINGIDRTEHSNAIDHAVVCMILGGVGEGEGSVIVRMEVVVALQNFVLVFENAVVAVVEKEMLRESQFYTSLTNTNSPTSLMSPMNFRRLHPNNNNARMRNLLANAGANLTITGAEAAYYQQQLSGGGNSSNSVGGGNIDSMRRVASSSSLSNLMNVFIPPSTVGVPHHHHHHHHHVLPSSPGTPPSSSSIPSPSGPASSSSSSSSIYTRVYNALLSYERDPDSGVARLAHTVLEYLRGKAVLKQGKGSVSIARESSSTSLLESSTESVGRVGSSTPTRGSVSSAGQSITPIVGTNFIRWCWSQFSRPTSNGRGLLLGGIIGNVARSQEELDPQDSSVCIRSWVYSRNARIRRDCFKRVKAFPGKIEEQVVYKNLNDVLRVGGGNCVVKFHPYENLVVVAGPGIVTTESGSASLSSSLEVVSGGGASSGIGIGNASGGYLIDKSVFVVFEYDDTSHLTSLPISSLSSSSQSSHHHHHSHSSSSSNSSALVQPRIVSKMEIEHTGAYYSPAQSINSLEWFNSHDSVATNCSSLLATGCDDGCIRVYRVGVGIASSGSGLVSSWGLCSNMGTWSSGGLSRVAHVLLKYEQECKRLVVSYCKSGKGVIGVWDVGDERLVREIGWSGGNGDTGVVKKLETSGGCNEWVRCLDCNRCEPNVFIVGGEDGSIRLLDFRVPPSETAPSSTVSLWKDFSGNSSASTGGAALSVRLRSDRTVVAGFNSGRVRFYDLRSKGPTKTVETGLDVSSVDVHMSLPYFGIGTTSSTLNIYGFNGPAAFQSNSIREGFGGFGRLGLASNSITAVGFHDFKPIVGFIDSYSHFSVYKAKKHA